MKSVTLVKIVRVGLIACGLLAAVSFPLAAQEGAPQQEGSGGHMGMQKMMEKHPGIRRDMHKMYEQMKKIQQETSQELQKQMTALRKHTKVMEGISDEKQLLVEMQKHQHMTDTLLGTMLGQKEKIHAQMQKQHEQMHGQTGKDQPSEGSGTEPSEEHE